MATARTRLCAKEPGSTRQNDSGYRPRPCSLHSPLHQRAHGLFLNLLSAFNSALNSALKAFSPLYPSLRVQALLSPLSSLFASSLPFSPRSSPPLSLSVLSAYDPSPPPYPSLRVQALPSLRVRALPSLRVRALPSLRVRALPSLRVRALLSLRVRALPSLRVRARLLPRLTIRRGGGSSAG